MTRKISQETFDDVVRENVDDFDQSPEEALKDAICQFKKQGVDLSNVDITGGIGREEMLLAIEQLRVLSLVDSSSLGEAGLIWFEELTSLCSSSNAQIAERNRMLMMRKGGVNVVHLFLDIKYDADVLTRAMKLLSSLSKASVEIRDFFEPGGSNRLCTILKKYASIIASATVSSSTPPPSEPAASSTTGTEARTDSATEGDELRAEESGIQDVVNACNVVLAGLALARTVCKTENTKALLMREGVGEVISTILQQHTLILPVLPSSPTPIAASAPAATTSPAVTVSKTTATSNNSSSSSNSDSGRGTSSCSSSDAVTALMSEILLESCQLMRGLCVHDDLRRDMSCAYENGRFFLKQSDVAKLLIEFANYFKAAPQLASVALSAARNLITTEDAVKVMALYGAMDLPFAVLSYPEASAALVRSCLGLMRNLCADDRRKDSLISNGILNFLVGAMVKEEYAADPLLMEHAVACLAAMSLRSPSNAQRIVATNGSIDSVVQAMRRHSAQQSLQRQGCLLIRNIAARCVELRSVLLDCGVEAVLRSAGRLQSAIDEAYAALRDLGCEVQYVKVSAEGKIEAAYEQFGQQTRKTPLNFNPVYDSDGAIEERVAEEARAPFAAPRPPLSEQVEEFDEDAVMFMPPITPFAASAVSGAVAIEVMESSGDGSSDTAGNISATMQNICPFIGEGGVGGSEETEGEKESEGESAHTHGPDCTHDHQHDHRAH